MTALNSFILLSCFFLCTTSFAQTKELMANEGEERIEKDQPFDWKPFSFELNSTILYTHGISFEKAFKEKLSLRISASSDFMKYEFIKTTPRVLKIKMGMMYTVGFLPSKKFSFRTGLEIGIKSQPDNFFFGDIRPNGLIDVPLLLEYKFSDNFALNLGAMSSYHRSSMILTSEYESKIYFFERPHMGLRFYFLK